MFMWQFVGQIAMMILSAVIGWLGGKIKGAKQEREEAKQSAQADREKTREVQRLLLFYRLKDLNDEYVVNRKRISSAEKLQIEEIYNLYKELGGNGEGTRLYQELMDLKAV